MVLTTLEDWRRWNGTYSMFPCVTRYEWPTAQIPSWEDWWRVAGPWAFVLESGKGGRYTFFGMDPESIISGKGKHAVIRDRGKPETCSREGMPLQLIREWMAPFRSPVVPGAPKWTGGCVGYLGYDLVRQLERLPDLAADDLGLPDYVLMRVQSVWALDHEEQCLYCIHQTWAGPEPKPDAWLKQAYQAAVAETERMKRLFDEVFSSGRDSASAKRWAWRQRIVQQEDVSIDPEQIEGIRPSFSKEGFCRAVEQIQQYISRGDVYQVNLSTRLSRRLQTRPEAIYEWLRHLNPSPYMAYLKLDGLELVSASPELLVQLEGRRIRTRPIAGTRKRGDSLAKDLALRDELLASEKERAEHVMLVDLERNDLGRVSEFGSVQVTDWMTIEYYSHVMHIVSEVAGQLAADKDAYDLIAAVFPGGTITGAPKIRTMEIIEELEPVRRGPYTGSIGWIDYHGNMELNIIIRTLVVKDGIGHVQAGAGIVIDSVPALEYRESLNKAKAIWKAVEFSDRYEGETI